MGAAYRASLTEEPRKRETGSAAPNQKLLQLSLGSSYTFAV